MPYKVELLDSSMQVVGFFEVARTTRIVSLPARVRRAAKARGAHSAMYWQVKRPDGRLLFRKVRIKK